jgi:hypothetical protein
VTGFQKSGVEGKSARPSNDQPKPLKGRISKVEIFSIESVVRSLFRTMAFSTTWRTLEKSSYSLVLFGKPGRRFIVRRGARHSTVSG